MKNPVAICLFATLLPGAALAHPGHIAEAAGHGHWIGLAAAGIAIGLAIWAGLKGGGQSESGIADADGATEEEPAA